MDSNKFIMSKENIQAKSQNKDNPEEKNINEAFLKKFNLTLETVISENKKLLRLSVITLQKYQNDFITFLTSLSVKPEYNLNVFEYPNLLFFIFIAKNNIEWASKSGPYFIKSILK